MDLDELDELDPVEEVDLTTQERDYGIVIYGATGYTGCLMVEHLDAILSQEGAKPMKWALAGRNVTKLRRIARHCKTAPAVLQARELSQIANICGQARVVVNASGPYMVTGEDIVLQCVNQVTHYIDVTGEVNFIHEMIKKYDMKAKERGVMIVHCSGAVCAPDELISYSLVKKLGPLKQYREYFLQYGSSSGGTFNTNIETMERLTQEALDIQNDPFCLGGKREGFIRDVDSDCTRVTACPLFPSVYLMPAYNERTGARIIRRTSELFEDNPDLGVQYGEKFYCVIRDCHMNQKAAEQGLAQVGPIPSVEAAKSAAAMMKAGRAGGQNAEPGDGAPAATRKIFSAEVYGVAESESGEWAYGHYTSGDAYEVTAMASIAGALCMVEELDRIQPKQRGGIITPAYAFHGTTWIERLTSTPFACNKENCKITFEVRDGMPSETQIVAAVKAKTKKIAMGQSQIMKGQLKSWTTPSLKL